MPATMQVKMKTRMAGPAGSADVGETIPVSKKQGQALVKGGYAEEIKAKPKVKAKAKDKETATAPPAETPEDGKKPGLLYRVMGRGKDSPPVAGTLEKPDTDKPTPAE